jgi:outer membrane protein assembly factor BamA
MKRLHLILFSTIFLFGVVSQVCAEAVLQSISIRGNRYYSERVLIGWSGLKFGKAISNQVLKSAGLSILQNLANEGYYFCRIDSMEGRYNADSTQVDVTFHLNEGSRLILKQFTVEGDSILDQGKLLLLSQVDKPFYSGDLQMDLQDVLSAGEETGHPFARLDLRRLQLQNDSLSVGVRLTPGPLAYLQLVRFIGLHSTKPRVLIRETRLIPGEIYRPSRIEKAIQHLQKLPFIEKVSPPALVPVSGNRYDLLLQVTEGKSNSFDGVVGYQPAVEGKKGTVTGLVDLSFMNLFGTGRKAKIHWERSSSFQQALELYYEEPWVAGLPINLWGHFTQEIQDSLYLDREISGGASLPLLDVLTVRGSLNSGEVIPDSAGRQILGLYQSHTIGAVLEAEYETRDLPENPTHGLYYRSSIGVARKEYESAANLGTINVHRYESDADWSYPLFRRQIVNVALHGRLLQSDEDPIPQPDLYRLGGSRTLRGYREDQFLGNITAWGSLEYRYWLDKESRIYAFFTMGYWERKPQLDNPKISGKPWGYGVGFRQGTRIGIIGFDFALGEGDVLATAKVHFRLINRF